jgi:hypothetical protein
VSALDRIRRRDFIGWTGLPADLAPADLGADGDPESWAPRRLGEAHEPARRRGLDLEGYRHPEVSVREGRVVLFDGAFPQLDYDALIADLGDPEERLDYVHGFIHVGEGEWIYGARGITVFINTDATQLLHIAVYAPTTVAEYVAHLRPKLGSTPRPLPTPLYLLHE